MGFSFSKIEASAPDNAGSLTCSLHSNMLALVSGIMLPAALCVPLMGGEIHLLPPRVVIFTQNWRWGSLGSCGSSNYGCLGYYKAETLYMKS